MTHLALVLLCGGDLLLWTAIAALCGVVDLPGVTLLIVSLVSLAIALPVGCLAPPDDMGTWQASA